jgi:hypothetical protein
MSIPHLLRALTVTVLAAFVASGCEDEVTGIDDSLAEGEISFDASDPADFTYLTFAEGGSVVSVSDPQTSMEWDIAFRRFSVKLNGGVAGPGTVAGFNVENHADADSADVVDFTSAEADAAWEAVTVDDIAGATFIEDGLVEDDSGPWFRFDPIGNTLVANSGAAWKMREADGGFALFRVSDMTLAGDLLGDITLEYRRQDAGGSLGALSSVTVAFPPGPPNPAFIDLESASSVTPMGGCEWDLSVTPFYTIDFNTACDAGTFPLDAGEDFAAMTQADDAPDYGGFLSVISGAIPSTVDDASAVFWYNIEGNNFLWPTYNVFLLRVGSAVYKVQVTDYYDATQQSGFPTLRFKRLQ